MEAGQATRKKTAAGVMQHPVRVQILVVANEREISASRFVEQVFGLSPTERAADYKRALSHVSYHFRALEEAGCIEVADLIQRRGAYERVYRGTLRARFPEADWSNVPDDEKARITKVAWQGLVARTEQAMLAGTLDRRDERTVAWTAAKLDERGFAEAMQTIIDSYGELERIRQDAEARLEETGDEATPTTFAMLGYESPTASCDTP
jgi:DNA-binding transcriptional ArsR family regulator